MPLHVGLLYEDPAGELLDIAEGPVHTMLMFMRPEGKLHLFEYLSKIHPAVTHWSGQRTAFFLCIQDVEARAAVGDADLVARYTEEIAGVSLFRGAPSGREENFFVFRESDVPEIAEMATVLQGMIESGDWRRIRTEQRRTARYKKRDIIEFPRYPIYRAAHAFAYQVDGIIISPREVAQIKWAGLLAERFQKSYQGGPILHIPRILHPMEWEPIRAFDDVRFPMGETSAAGCIFLLDPLASTARKFRRLQIEEGPRIYNPMERPVMSNLLTLARWITGSSYESLSQTHFADIEDDEEFKRAVKDMVYKVLRPLQQSQRKKCVDGSIDEALQEGAEQARNVAAVMRGRIQEVMGGA